MPAVNLGLPKSPPPTLAERGKTRQIQVGDVQVGSEAPISVQSMTTTQTTDINGTLQQIAELTASGCDIVRVACHGGVKQRLSGQSNGRDGRLELVRHVVDEVALQAVQPLGLAQAIGGVYREDHEHDRQ